jgi:polar amino acid transport system substrate-binding protein
MSGSRARCCGFVAAVALAFTAGCASVSDEATRASRAALRRAEPAAATGDADVAAPATKPCDPADPAASHRPEATIPSPLQMPAGTEMAAIQGRGKLRVGVDENTIGFSARDPLTGEFAGFEADLARQIASAMLGSEGAVSLVTVTTPEKLPKVVDGTVDMTISVVSMSCERWQDVDFSTAYYEAVQQLLVPGDSTITGQGDLPGKRVCVTEGSSSQKFLEASMPDVRVRPVATRTACLVRLQENRVDAVVLPSSILAGLHAQDPTTRLVDASLVDEAGVPATNVYGVAVNDSHPELVRYVNALLERWRADGTLADMQARHVAPLELPVSVPTARYRD